MTDKSCEGILNIKSKINELVSRSVSAHEVDSLMLIWLLADNLLIDKLYKPKEEKKECEHEFVWDEKRGDYRCKCGAWTPEPPQEPVVPEKIDIFSDVVIDDTGIDVVASKVNKILDYLTYLDKRVGQIEGGKK